MKKYSICLYLFLAASLICLLAGYLVRSHELRAQTERTVTRESGRDSIEEREGSGDDLTAGETQTASEDQMAANRQLIQNRVAEEYYLVSEDGFLLVFLKDRETICLYTHVPILDFPDAEQEKLREGIWFPSMMEVFQYLESYTS